MMTEHGVPWIRTKLGIMMFLQIAIWGAWLPCSFGFFGEGGLGFSANQVTWLIECFPIAAIIAMFAANQWVDRKFAAEKFLAFSQLVAGLTMLAFGLLARQHFQAIELLPKGEVAPTPNYWLFLGLMAVHCFFYVPTMTVTNKIAFANLKNPAKDFGPVRLWGTIGWIAAAWPFIFILTDWILVDQKLEALKYAQADKAIAIKVDSITKKVKENKKKEDGTIEEVEVTKTKEVTVNGKPAEVIFSTPTFVLFDKKPLILIADAKTELTKTEAATVTIGDAPATIQVDGQPAEIVQYTPKQRPADNFIGQLGIKLGTALSGNALNIGKSWAFIVAGSLCLILAVFSLTLPHTPPKKIESGEKRFAWLEAVQYLKKPFLLILFIVTLIDATVHDGFFFFAFSYLETVGVPSNWIQPAMTIGQIAEIFTMAILGYVLKRFGWRWTMIVGILGHAARFAVFAYVPDPYAAVAINIVHGICYAFFFATLYILVDEVFPADARASAQGLFNLLVFGLGPITARFLWPAIKDHYKTGDGATAIYDYQSIFLYPTGLAVIGAALLLFLFHPPTRGPEGEVKH